MEVADSLVLRALSNVRSDQGYNLDVARVLCGCLAAINFAMPGQDSSGRRIDSIQNSVSGY